MPILFLISFSNNYALGFTRIGREIFDASPSRSGLWELGSVGTLQAAPPSGAGATLVHASLTAHNYLAAVTSVEPDR